MQPKIKRVSLLFRLLFQIAFVILPITHIVAWIYAPASFNLFSSDNWTAITFRAIPDSIEILHTLSLQDKILGFLITAIPVVISELLLYYLIRLFHLYEKGEIFSLSNVRYIKKAGYALLMTEISTPITNSILSLAMTWQNPAGHRTATLSLSGVDAATLMTAVLIILVSWIMAEGCQLREEQRLTI